MGSVRVGVRVETGDLLRWMMGWRSWPKRRQHRAENALFGCDARDRTAVAVHRAFRDVPASIVATSFWGQSPLPSMSTLTSKLPAWAASGRWLPSQSLIENQCIYRATSCRTKILNRERQMSMMQPRQMSLIEHESFTGTYAELSNNDPMR